MVPLYHSVPKMCTETLVPTSALTPHREGPGAHVQGCWGGLLSGADARGAGQVSQPRVSPRPHWVLSSESWSELLATQPSGNSGPIPTLSSPSLPLMLHLICKPFHHYLQSTLVTHVPHGRPEGSFLLCPCLLGLCSLQQETQCP